MIEDLEVDFSTFIKGFILAINLIFPIGVQNLYVLRQGLLGRHVFATALVCSLSDVFLIWIGGAGIGMALDGYPEVKRWIMYLASIFLVYYGFHCLYRAWKGKVTAESLEGEEGVASLQRSILTALGFSLLNPQGILETTIVIGGYAAAIQDYSQKFSFLIGATVASIAWFFSLGYGAKFLRPLFKSHVASRVLDIVVACFVFYIAYKLSQQEVPFFM